MMTDVAWNTIAGALWASVEIEPYFPPTREELNRVHAHTFAAGLPVDLLNEWLVRINVESVKDIRSYDALYGLWLLMGRWQIEHDVGTDPVCPIGLSIYRQIQHSWKTMLTPRRTAL